MEKERVPILKHYDVLIVPVHDELSDTERERLEINLLEKISKSGVRAVVLDVSSLEALDRFTARKLVQLVKMIALMDVKTVLVGMRPAVAITLTDMEVSFPGICTALTLEHATAILKGKKN